MCWKMRILCLYKCIITKSNIIWKSYTYRSRSMSMSRNRNRNRSRNRSKNRNRNRSKNRSRCRGSSTTPCRHQPWKSGILLLEIKRKVVILGLKIIILILLKTQSMFNRRI